MQGVDSSFHTDLFMPLIHRAEEVVGRAYEPDTESGVSFRVLADHARAVSFLIADGVFPTNEGRGYVLRRILRRAGRHAWLLGRREPTLYMVCDEVVTLMSDVYHELDDRRDHILRTARGEEERFMATIDEGMERFEQLAPAGGSGTVSGREAFKLYDTFGFPPDLTQLMAEERGYHVDMVAFEEALEEQRRRSRDERDEQRRRGDLEVKLVDVPTAGWTRYSDDPQEWVGYEQLNVDTDVLAAVRENGRIALELRWNPFYAEAAARSATGASWKVMDGGWKSRASPSSRIE